MILGPAFVATATATGAAATRLVLVASGLPHGHPTRRALGTIETASMLTELSISAFGERRLGDAAEALRRGRPGTLLPYRQEPRRARLSRSGLVARRTGPREHELASVMYLAAGLLFRFAWVYAGKPSATDDAAVAAIGRGRRALNDEREQPRQQRAPFRAAAPHCLCLPAVHRRYTIRGRSPAYQPAIERLVRRRPAQ